MTDPLQGATTEWLMQKKIDELITERDTAMMLMREYKQRALKAEAERDSLRQKLSDAREAGDASHERANRLEAERDEWRERAEAKFKFMCQQNEHAIGALNVTIAERDKYKAALQRVAGTFGIEDPSPWDVAREALEGEA